MVSARSRSKAITPSELAQRVRDVADNTRDMVVDLAAQVRHLKERIETMSQTDEKILEQVSELHDVLLKAKGAQWVLIGVTGLVGMIFAKFTWLITLLGFRQ